ncbi:MAG: serine hydrolase domain-containing protein [Acidimicrobiia bacterium]|nr:serine hydrolase domain-containing protein [Acidimicrobiia bacterium]
MAGRRNAVTALELPSNWPVPNVAVSILHGGSAVGRAGDPHHRFRLASISKPISAWAALIAVEEGIVALDTPIGQPGCTLRHLLAHAGGYPFEGVEPIARPERTRIYSNAGYQLLADELARRAEMPFADYLAAAVFEPLGMSRTDLVGSPAHGVHSCASDLQAFVQEIMRPTLLDPATRDEAIRPQFPSLSGIVPGVGRFERCPWGLGFELRGEKQPHWTGRHNVASTYGHFGGAGTMLWVDPDADLAVIALTDREFGPWALEAWPQFSDAVLAEFGGATP